MAQNQQAMNPFIRMKIIASLAMLVIAKNIEMESSDYFNVNYNALMILFSSHLFHVLTPVRETAKEMQQRYHAQTEIPEPNTAVWDLMRFCYQQSTIVLQSFTLLHLWHNYETGGDTLTRVPLTNRLMIHFVALVFVGIQHFRDLSLAQGFSDPQATLMKALQEKNCFTPLRERVPQIKQSLEGVVTGFPATVARALMPSI